MFRQAFVFAASLLAAAGPAGAGLPYYTGYETNPAPPAVSFPTGFDVFYTTPSPDDWKASASHSGLKLHSIEPESVHTQRGMGNVIYLGGNPAALPQQNNGRTVGSTVQLYKTFNIDPVAANQEIVTLSVLLGITDSTSTTAALPRRDNFEFAFYNQSSQIIGFIQFDNNTLATTVVPPVSAQKIFRSSYQTSPLPAGLKAVDTGDVFYYDTIMNLVVRINFRTNRWTALLDSAPLFSDEVFYTGPYVKTLGSVAVQLQIKNSGGFPQQLAPGDNLMLFDDFFLRADPIPDAEIYDFTRNAAGSVSFTWLTEAQYRYQVQYTDNLTTDWLNSLPGSLTTAASTGTAPFFTDATAAGHAARFYRIKRMYP